MLTHTHTHTHTQRHDVKYKPDHVTLFLTNSERWTVGSSSHVRDRFLYKTLLAPVVWLPFQPRFPSYLTHYCLIVQLYDRGWDGWRALPTWWTWVWVDSGSWWWIGRSGMLQSMGSQRDTTEQLNWTEPAIPNSHSSLHQEFRHLHSFLLPCDLCPLSLLSFSTPPVGLAKSRVGSRLSSDIDPSTKSWLIGFPPCGWSSGPRISAPTPEASPLQQAPNCTLILVSYLYLSW